MKSTIGLNTPTVTNGLINQPPTNSGAQSYDFVHGAAQLFRVSCTVTVGSNMVADGSHRVRLGPFWTTPNVGHVFLFAGFTVVTAFTTTGSPGTIGFELNVNDITSTPNYALAAVTAAGTAGGGTYGVSGSNRVRMSMASDPSASLFIGGNGNQDFLSPADGSFFQSYGSSLFGSPVYAYILGAGAWTLTGGQFKVNLAGFFT